MCVRGVKIWKRRRFGVSGAPILKGSTLGGFARSLLNKRLLTGMVVDGCSAGY